MSFFNTEQTRINKAKEELKEKTDEELKEIAESKVRTSFFGFTAGDKMIYKTAAFQLLRERANKN